MANTFGEIETQVEDDSAPARLKEAGEEMRQFIFVAPEVGDVLLWESFLRHEVPMKALLAVLQHLLRAVVRRWFWG